MICKNCNCCHKILHPRWDPEKYSFVDKVVYKCFGVSEPFEIVDINSKCTEYPHKREE